MPIVQFTPLSSLVQPDFWHALTSLKIDVLKLSDASVAIRAAYTAGRTIRDRETGQEVPLGCELVVSGEAFTEEFQPPANAVAASGVFKNYNTIEDFKAADKTVLFNQVADEIWTSVKTNHDPSALNRFLLIAYADLKKYKYYYWFAFPAFTAKPAWTIASEWKPAHEELSEDAMRALHDALVKAPRAYWLVRIRAGKTEVAGVEEYEKFFEGVDPASQYISFLDPSALPQNPGWPLRNLLAYLRCLHPSTTSSLRVLCWRDTDLPASGSTWKSRLGLIEQGISENREERPSAVGWEKNAQGRLGPRVADLAPMMDPTRLADQAVDLNLKLMRWRILPALDLDKIAATKCLLLGAGTLGCYVARTLMGWGVRKITFVDSARVSFSNPVRQPLFEFEDCLDGGKPKAQCAADRLKKIFPGVESKGFSLSIPMPGHPVPAASVEQTKKDVQMLETLVEQHDAVFLLMDSRESRWLPTVLGAAKGKIVMNAALGFDTFLVMRHGARGGGEGRLGCYYCNDIVAPADSLTDRTLDQMCTVTRPGLASIAASTAVELLAGLVQHPDGVRAPAPPPQTGNSNDLPDPSTSGSILGLVPHQLRGFLAQFRNMLITGAAYDRCTGCSETVLREYETKGWDMMIRAFNEPGYLEELTGLKELYGEGEAAMESVDWEEEEEE
ncbi:E1-like protein-activating [Heliocybe sulcata]|uniref:Ubiquitin-like modifier-activating enzyme ATG7 n=1 Tax=Heliocybe sulcata TaxID=5364 RepID=A0A5C3N8B3_9AGAM|nr:E1-like protein-activating [Heliocybe sulcata]